MTALGTKIWNQLPSQLFDLLTKNIVPENNPDPLLLPHAAIPLLLCYKTTLLYYTFASLSIKKLRHFVVTFCIILLQSMSYLVLNSVLKIILMLVLSHLV